MTAGLLLLVAGCLPAVDVEARGSADTAADSLSVHDSGDSASRPAWNPGDDIPGWPTADCGLSPTELVEALVLPWDGSGGDPIQGMVFLRPTDAYVLNHFGCADGCRQSVEDPNMMGYFLSTATTVIQVPPGALPGEGESTYESCEHAEQTASGGVHSTPEGGGSERGAITVFCDDTATSGQVVAEFHECLTDFRPDKVVGAVWWDLLGATHLGTGFPEGVRYVYIAFDILVPPGVGYYGKAGDSPIVDLPDAARGTHYNVAYDDAWPWDSITDPDIRQQVYDLYAPINPEDAP